MLVPPDLLFFFFFNDTATTEIYTLSLHDALPISQLEIIGSYRAHRGNCAYGGSCERQRRAAAKAAHATDRAGQDRKSTRLNSSHDQISYAVFCLKKKKKTKRKQHTGHWKIDD